MGLAERILSKKPKEMTVSVDGLDFIVRGLTKTQRSGLMASAPKKGRAVDNDQLEELFLSTCVIDPATNSPVIPVEQHRNWGQVPAEITGALFAVVMQLNGLDNEDVGKTVKKSEATDTPG